MARTKAKAPTLGNVFVTFKGERNRDDVEGALVVFDDGKEVSFVKGQPVELAAEQAQVLQADEYGDYKTLRFDFEEVTQAHLDAAERPTTAREEAAEKLRGTTVDPTSPKATTTRKSGTTAPEGQGGASPASATGGTGSTGTAS